MILAIMQPYFFPYIGYFQLINAVDKFIVFDVVQYIDKGWMNRNRILSQNIQKEWEYVSIPVDKIYKRKMISEVLLGDELNWDEILFGKLSYYKRIRAPYYKNINELIIKIASKCYKNITDLNVEILKSICDYIGIEFDYKIATKENYDFSSVSDKDDWALQVSMQEKATCYLNPIGGLDFFDRQKYYQNEIDIKFLKTKSIFYPQSKREFVPNLSIIDVMMFNSPEEIRGMLSEFELV